MTKKPTRAKQIERLARDGAILSASIVLTAANDYLTPQQQRAIRSINKRAAKLNPK